MVSQLTMTDTRRPAPAFTQAARLAAAKALTRPAGPRLDSTAPYLGVRDFAVLLERIGEHISYWRLRQILGLPIHDLPPSIRRVLHPDQTDPWYSILPAICCTKKPRQYCIPLATLAPLFQQFATTHHLAKSLEHRLPPDTVALCHRFADTPTLSYATFRDTTPTDQRVTRHRFYRIKNYFKSSQRTFCWQPPSPTNRVQTPST